MQLPPKVSDLVYFPGCLNFNLYNEMDPPADHGQN